MKFLKAKFIVLYLLVLAVGICLLTYFVGGLKASAVTTDSLAFDFTKYTSYEDYDVNGKYTGTGDAATHPDLQTARIVAQNDKYTMFLNELTTVVTVAVNSSCTATTATNADGYIAYDLATATVSYSSSLDATSGDDTLSSAERSLFLMDYVDADGNAVTATFNTYDNSVHYENKLTSSYERHYYVNFNTENGIEICYRVGNFVLLTSFFPTYWERSSYEALFRGNTMMDVTIDSSGSTDVMKYTGTGITWSEDVATWLAAKYGEDHVKAHEYKDSLNLSTATYWDLSGFATDGVLTLEAGVDYNTATGWALDEETNEFVQTSDASPCTMNPYMNSKVWDYVSTGNSYSLVTYMEDSDSLKALGYSSYDGNPKQYLQNASTRYKFDASSATSLTCQKTYNYLYNTSSDNYYMYLTHTTPTYYQGSPVQVGGYQERDADGNFIYDEDGTAHRTTKNDFVTELKAIAETQNSIYGEDSSTYPPVFQAAFQFTLDDSGYNVNIIGNSLREGDGEKATETLADGTISTTFSHAYRFHTLTLFPYMTVDDGSPVDKNGNPTTISKGNAVAMTSEGIIVLPDGSGAVMSFNSVKDDLDVAAVTKAIYGTDLTDVDTYNTASGDDFTMAMYGFLAKTQKKGVLAICSEGASQLTLTASFIRKSTLYTTKQYNRAYYTLELRASKKVKLGSSKSYFTQWQKSFAKNDYKFKFELLDVDQFVDSDGKIEYVTLAKMYRSYLETIYPALATKKDETTDNVVTLNFLGAISKRTLVLGFPYYKKVALTTFDEAQQIVDILSERGVTDMNVVYTGWTSDGVKQKVRNSVDAASVLGGNTGLKDLEEYLAAKNISFYPAYQITSNYGYGDYSWGNNKYTSKTVTNELTQRSEYNLATNVSDKTGLITNMISPRFYQALMRNYLSSFDRYGISGTFFTDLGNVKVGDYAKKVSTYSSLGILYQMAALSDAKSVLDDVMLSAPYDYAFQYATNVVDLPAESTLLSCYDYSIPFLQLVCSGWFDYAADAVNMDSEHATTWYFLKALETGANLYFNLSYENTTMLLDTSYTKYFNSYYVNWVSTIVEMNKEINASGIHEGILTSHKSIADNVYEVTYSKTNAAGDATDEIAVRLIVNYNDTNYYDTATGFSVKAEWYTIVESNL